MVWIREKRMFYSIREAAEETGIPLPTLDHKIHYQGVIKPLQLGKKTLILSHAQLEDIKEKGWSDKEVDASSIFTNRQAVKFLHGLGLKMSYSALVFARDSGVLPYERVGGTEDRAAILIYHKEDLIVFAAERGAPEFVPAERHLFSVIEAEGYTAELGERVPRPTLRHNARVQGKIHPAEIDGVEVYSAEQLRDFISSPADDRRSDIKIDRDQIMTIAEAAEHLGLEQQEVKYQVFVNRTLPYEPVGVSSKGVQLFLLRRSDVEALKKELEK